MQSGLAGFGYEENHREAIKNRLHLMPAFVEEAYTKDSYYAARYRPMVRSRSLSMASSSPATLLHGGTICIRGSHGEAAVMLQISLYLPNPTELPSDRSIRAEALQCETFLEDLKTHFRFNPRLNAPEWSLGEQDAKYTIGNRNSLGYRNDTDATVRLIFL